MNKLIRFLIVTAAAIFLVALGLWMLDVPPAGGGFEKRFVRSLGVFLIMWAGQMILRPNR